VETGLFRPDPSWGRYYDPATGRWMTRDPIGFAGGDPNLLRYVRNSPTNLIDPSGLDIYLVTGEESAWNPIINELHQYVCVDTPDGLLCFSFSAVLDWPTLWINGNWFGDDTTMCCIATGIVYFKWGRPAKSKVIERKKTTREQDAEFQAKMTALLVKPTGYSLGRHSCRDFSQMMFKLAPCTSPCSVSPLPELPPGYMWSFDPESIDSYPIPIQPPPRGPMPTIIGWEDDLNGGEIPIYAPPASPPAQDSWDDVTFSF